MGVRGGREGQAAAAVVGEGVDGGCGHGRQGPDHDGLQRGASLSAQVHEKYCNLIV